MMASEPTAERSWSSTESQNRWGSCSSRRTETHAVRSARLVSSIHERRSTVLPLPGGAETRKTPSADPADRRSKSSGRSMTDGGCLPEVIEDASPPHRLTRERVEELQRLGSSIVRYG
jgi:hypothetical protein